MSFHGKTDVQVYTSEFTGKPLTIYLLLEKLLHFYQQASVVSHKTPQKTALIAKTLAESWKEFLHMPKKLFFDANTFSEWWF